jgi:RsiW-degrading membrane proteinase PrsW (M82 family)
MLTFCSGTCETRTSRAPGSTRLALTSLLMIGLRDRINTIHHERDHGGWTGLAAAALWQAAARGWSGRAVGGLVDTYGLAVVLHTLWDSLDNLIAYVVLAVIALGLLGAVTHHLTRNGPGGSSG